MIQPYDQRERFDHDLGKLVDYLCDKYNDPIYGEMDKYDVGAAYYDWDDGAVGILTKLIRVTASYVVIHSDWRMANNLVKSKGIINKLTVREIIDA